MAKKDDTDALAIVDGVEVLPPTTPDCEYRCAMLTMCVGSYRAFTGR